MKRIPLNKHNSKFSWFNYDLTSAYKPFIEELRPGGHVLDAGCGPGRDSLYFIKNGFAVTGIDASHEMVKIDVLVRLFKALKNGGVFYASFKYGNREEEIGGRLFNFYDEHSWDDTQALVKFSY